MFWSMCNDRLDGNQITITHRFLSMMLAVRRSGVTDAIHILEGRGLIRSTRGTITINDQVLEAGDGASIENETVLRIEGEGEFLLFDLN